MNQWIEDVVNRIEAEIMAIYQTGVTTENVIRLLSAIIEGAEEVVEGERRGADKKNLVYAVIGEIKTRFDIANWLDDMIRLPFFLEKIDNIIIGHVMDEMIDGIVAVLNKHVWKDV